MPKNMTKILRKYLLLSLSLFTVILTGCGSSSDSISATSESNIVSEETVPATEATNGTESIDAGDTEATEETEAPPADYHILFVGNSFTHYNNMPKMFLAITEDAGYNVAVDSVTKGSWTLLKFGSADDTYGQQVIEKLAETEYDYVIIQEQSTTPIKKPGHFYDGVRNLYTLINENGATPVLYETWGYNTGYLTLDSYGKDTPDMEMKLRAAYSAIGDELDIDVSYVGAAMSDVFVNHPDVNLYNSDHKHPSYKGSTLAALTLFADIFDTDPRTVAYSDEDIDEEIMNILKEAAYQAAFGEIVIAEDAVTSSDGVVAANDEE